MFKWEIKGVVGRGMVGGGLVVGRVEWFWKKCYTLCYPKISTNKYVKAFFKPATGGNVFFDFLKLKMKRTFVLSCTDQNSFANLKKIIIFKVPVIFGKWKLCRACDVRSHGQNCRFFGIELLKIYLDRQTCVLCRFSKIENSAKSLHPRGGMVPPPPNRNVGLVYCFQPDRYFRLMIRTD